MAAASAVIAVRFPRTGNGRGGAVKLKKVWLLFALTLALLLAGPALSLPSMLVINSVLGFKKTFVYVTLVVVMSTVTGMIYGSFFN